MKTVFSLRCFDPRYPLGYPDDQGEDLSDLQRLCDQKNAQAVAEDGAEEYWIVQDNRVIYPEQFAGLEQRFQPKELASVTPWGVVLAQEDVQPGITWVSTNSHGGYHLSPQLNTKIPRSVRRRNGFYNQDVEAALPAYFVMNIAPGMKANALLMIETNYPDVYVEIIKGTYVGSE